MRARGRLIENQESRWRALALRRASSTALVIAALASATAATWRVRASSPRLGPGVPQSRPEPQPPVPIRLIGQTAAPSFARAADRDLLATVRDRVERGDPRVPATEVDRWILRLASDPAYRNGFEEALGRMTRYEALIRQTLRRHGLPEELLYLVMVESEFRESAVSHAGATGMWQFMAPTGRLYDLEVSEYVDERRDPIRSTVAAAEHLRDLHVEFGSWHLALAAYNAGSGRVARAAGRRAGGRRGDERLYWQIRARLPRETQRYVPLYLAAAEIARRPRAFGLNPRPHPVLAFDEVWVPGGVTLDSVARSIAVATASVQQLNPHLVRGMTPPGRRWPVRIPPRLNASATLENSGR